MTGPRNSSSARGPGALAGDSRALGGALLAVVCTALGFAVRYGFVEPVALGEACEASAAWWCPLRTGLIVFTQWGGFGWIALAAGLAALAALAARLAVPARALAVVAIVAGGFGMLLYNTTASVPATILAVLVLIGSGRLKRL